MANRLVVALIIALFSLSTEAKSEIIINNEGTSGLLIVFVHGLLGDPQTTFSTRDNKTDWQTLIANDGEPYSGQFPLAETSVVTLGYDVSAGSLLSVPEISGNLLQELLDSGLVRQHEEIVFVTYSLGGIVAKEILLRAADHNLPLATKTKRMIQLAVPAEGTDIESIIGALGRLLDAIAPSIKPRAVDDLEAIFDNSFLQVQAARWQQFIQNTGINIYCAYEKQRTFGKLIVPRSRLDPHCGGILRAFEGNHFDIKSPSGKQDEIYQWVASRITEVDAYQIKKQTRGYTELGLINKSIEFKGRLMGSQELARYKLKFATDGCFYFENISTSPNLRMRILDSTRRSIDYQNAYSKSGHPELNGIRLDVFPDTYFLELRPFPDANLRKSFRVRIANVSC